MTDRILLDHNSLLWLLNFQYQDCNACFQSGWRENLFFLSRKIRFAFFFLFDRAFCALFSSYHSISSFSTSPRRIQSGLIEAAGLIKSALNNLNLSLLRLILFFIALLKLSFFQFFSNLSHFFEIFYKPKNFSCYSLSAVWIEFKTVFSFFFHVSW